MKAQQDDWRDEYCEWVFTSAGWLPAWRVIEMLQRYWVERFRGELAQIEEDIWK